MTDSAFTPALGHAGLTRLYDSAIATLTREKVWRKLVVDTLAPRNGETIADIGAGTGSLALMIKSVAPSCRLVAIDPDPEVRTIGEGKAKAAGVNIEYVTAMGDAVIDAIPTGGADAVTCSLVLHQCPLEVKRAILMNAARLLRSGGRLVLADYGAQPDVLMRIGFLLVQNLDGFEATEHNRRGVLPHLIEESGLAPREPIAQVRTTTGAISIWRALKG